jgi:hypothetical protein
MSNENQDDSSESLNLPLLAGYTVSFGSENVTLLPIDFVDEFGCPPLDNKLAVLSPGEAVQIARQILARAEHLEAQEQRILTQCEEVSQAVLSLFAEAWRRATAEAKWPRRGEALERGPVNDYTEFDRMLREVFLQLTQDEKGIVGRWYRETHTEQVSLFWRYFNRTHWSTLLARCYPDTSADE